MTTAWISRERLVRHLSERFAGEPWVHAAWLGGSDATGRTDALSDVDFQVVVDDEDVERAFDRLHEVLEELAPIELVHRIPQPSWHGFHQEFLRLAQTDPHHVVDFAVVPASTPPERRLLERERHGTPVVVVDRAGWLDVPAPDRAAHGARLVARVETLRTTFPLFQPLVTRAVARGFAAEAAGFYQRFALVPLVELLRLRHAPERFDFGLRYLDRDLPDEARALLERLAFPADLADCERLRSEAVARFEAELLALERGEWRAAIED